MVADKRTNSVDELERLKAENEALRLQVARAEEVTTGRNARIRNIVAAGIMILATFALALAIPAIWVNRMVTSTDYYVATVSPLARDAAIQDAVATAASDAAIEQLDITTRLETRLPEDLAFLAAPISNAADDFIRKQATSFVRSESFPKLWDKANEVGHKAFVTAVTGKDTGAVQIQAGEITLDLGVLIDSLVAKLSESGFGLVDQIPRTGALDKTFTLYQSDTLAQAAVIVDALQRIALVLPLLGLALAGGAVALAANRRRALLWLGAGLLVFTLLPLQFLYIGQSFVGQQLQSLGTMPSEAAQNAYGIIFAALIDAEQLFVALSLLIILGALLAGPSKWARALRGALSGGIAGVSSHMELGVFGEWVGARMRALRTVGYLLAAALLVLLPRPRTMTQIWWVVGFVIVWLVAVQLFGSGSSQQDRVSDAETGTPEALPSDESEPSTEPV